MYSSFDATHNKLNIATNIFIAVVWYKEYIAD